MLEIRKMTCEDLDAVSVLEKETFSIPWSKSGFAEALDRSDTLYLTAVINETPCRYTRCPKSVDTRALQGINNEAPCGYPRCPKNMDRNNEAPCGYPRCPKNMDRNNERLVGYCGYLQILNEAYITNVAVDKNHRNQGVAGQMLDILIKYGNQQGITAYTLEVRKSNKVAIHLYEKLGFVSFGFRKNFYEKPTEDAVIMWKYG